MSVPAEQTEHQRMEFKHFLAAKEKEVPEAKKAAEKATKQRAAKITILEEEHLKDMKGLAVEAGMMGPQLQRKWQGNRVRKKSRTDWRQRRRWTKEGCWTHDSGKVGTPELRFVPQSSNRFGVGGVYGRGCGGGKRVEGNLWHRHGDCNAGRSAIAGDNFCNQVGPKSFKHECCNCRKRGANGTAEERQRGEASDGFGAGRRGGGGGLCVIIESYGR